MNKTDHERKRKEKRRMKRYHERSLKVTLKKQKLKMLELAKQKNISIPFLK